MREKLPELAAVITLSTAAALGAISLEGAEGSFEPPKEIVAYVREDATPETWQLGPTGEPIDPPTQAKGRTHQLQRHYSVRRVYGRIGQLPHRTRGDVHSTRLR